MNSKIDLRIGASVVCDGQECGKLTKLVSDPHTHRITDLIVQKGFLFTKDTVVPIEAVETTERDRVEISTPKDKLDELPEYKEQSYVAPPEGWPQDEQENAYALHRATPPYASYPELMVPMVVHRVRQGVSPNSSVIKRGRDVVGVDGKIGTVDHVLIDAETSELKLLVVDLGRILVHDVVIPADRITEIGDDVISVSLNEEQVKDLYHYRPRSNVDVMSEVEDRLSRIPVDSDSIKIALNGGVIRLSGIVPNVRIKRRIVGMIAPIDGILYIENELETAETIEARVVAALRSDPRTDIACIDVVAQQGSVRLSGQVDSETVKDAAGELAAAQQGVATVVNDLEVASDELSDHLRINTLAWAYFAQSPGDGKTQP